MLRTLVKWECKTLLLLRTTSQAETEVLRPEAGGGANCGEGVEKQFTEATPHLFVFLTTAEEEH